MHIRDDDEFVASIISRYDAAVSARSNFDSHWEEVASRVLPNYAGIFNGYRSPGEKKTEDQLDSTAALALTRFAAAAESMLTPRNSKWHMLMPDNPNLSKDRETRLWFEQVTDILFKYRYAPYANFSSQTYECYTSLGAFGNAALFIDPMETKGGRDKAGLRYSLVPLNTLYFALNFQGLVDTTFRRLEMTGRQMAQQFGADILPDSIRTAANKLDESKTFQVIHAVFPREDYDPIRKDSRGMKFHSVYISIIGKKILKESGYFTFPFAISRYINWPGEIYGRSPAMMVLPSIKVLNEQKRISLIQGHRSIDPVLLAHDDGILDSFSLTPGAINVGGVSAEGRPLVHVLPTGNVQIAKELMDAERAVINDAFLVTLFQILVDTPTMTATEVIERAREKGALLSPTFGRQQSEFLAPMIDRELDILSSMGALPPMPPALLEAKGEYTIQYDNPLSRAQKAEATAGTMRTIQYASEIYNVTQDPSIMRMFNFKEIIPDIAEANAMPIRHLATDEQIAEKEDAAAKAQQSQELVNAAPSMASVVKNLSTLKK